MAQRRTDKPIKVNRRPTHPGAILREDTLPALGLTSHGFAEVLGVSDEIINGILHERSSVTVDIAHRLARALDMSPDIWLRLQQAVDLYDAQENNRAAYEEIKPIAA